MMPPLPSVPPEPLVMAQEVEHVIDGSRPLAIGRQPLPAPRPTLHDVVAVEPLACSIHEHAIAHGMPPRPGCRQTILPGRHYLEHTLGSPSLGDRAKHAICASCAVREYHYWDVREASE